MMESCPHTLTSQGLTTSSRKSLTEVRSLTTLFINVADHRFKDLYFYARPFACLRLEKILGITAKIMIVSYQNIDLYQLLNLAFLIQQKTHNNKSGIISQFFHHLFFAFVCKMMLYQMQNKFCLHTCQLFCSSLWF